MTEAMERVVGEPNKPLTMLELVDRAIMAYAEIRKQQGMSPDRVAKDVATLEKSINQVDEALVTYRTDGRPQPQVDQTARLEAELRAEKVRSALAIQQRDARELQLFRLNARWARWARYLVLVATSGPVVAAWLRGWEYAALIHAFYALLVGGLVVEWLREKAHKDTIDQPTPEPKLPVHGLRHRVGPCGKDAIAKAVREQGPTSGTATVMSWIRHGGSLVYVRLDAGLDLHVGDVLWSTSGPGTDVLATNVSVDLDAIYIGMVASFVGYVPDAPAGTTGCMAIPRRF